MSLPTASPTAALSGSRDAVPASPLPGRSASSWDSVQARGSRRPHLRRGPGRSLPASDREDPRLRDRYGRHIHGQCSPCLPAASSKRASVLVTVNWHNDGQNFWDTHGDNFNQLKNRLMPPADQGFAAACG